MTSSLLSFPSSQFNCRSGKSSNTTTTESDSFFERRACVKRDSMQIKRQPTHTACRPRPSLSDVRTTKCRPPQYRLYIGQKSQEKTSRGDDQVDGTRLQGYFDARQQEGKLHRPLSSLEYALKRADIYRGSSTDVFAIDTKESTERTLPYERLPLSASSDEDEIRLEEPPKPLPRDRERKLSNARPQPRSTEHARPGQGHDRVIRSSGYDRIASSVVTKEEGYEKQSKPVSVCEQTMQRFQNNEVLRSPGNDRMRSSVPYKDDKERYDERSKPEYVVDQTRCVHPNTDTFRPSVYDRMPTSVVAKDGNEPYYVRPNALPCDNQPCYDERPNPGYVGDQIRRDHQNLDVLHAAGYDRIRSAFPFRDNDRPFGDRPMALLCDICGNPNIIVTPPRFVGDRTRYGPLNNGAFRPPDYNGLPRGYDEKCDDRTKSLLCDRCWRLINVRSQPDCIGALTRCGHRKDNAHHSRRCDHVTSSCSSRDDEENYDDRLKSLSCDRCRKSRRSHEHRNDGNDRFTDVLSENGNPELHIRCVLGCSKDTMSYPGPWQQLGQHELPRRTSRHRRFSSPERQRHPTKDRFTSGEESNGRHYRGDDAGGIYEYSKHEKSYRGNPLLKYMSSVNADRLHRPAGRLEHSHSSSRHRTGDKRPDENPYSRVYRHLFGDTCKSECGRVGDHGARRHSVGYERSRARSSSPARRRRSSPGSVYVISANVRKGDDVCFDEVSPRARTSRHAVTDACKTDYSKYDRGDEPSAVDSRTRSRQRHHIAARDLNPHAVHRRRYDRRPRDVPTAHSHPADARLSGDDSLRDRPRKHAVASGCKTDSSGHGRSGHRHHRHKHSRTVPDDRWTSDRAEEVYRTCSNGTSSSPQTDNDGLIDFRRKSSRHKQKSSSGHVSLRRAPSPSDSDSDVDLDLYRRTSTRRVGDDSHRTGERQRPLPVVEASSSRAFMTCRRPSGPTGPRLTGRTAEGSEATSTHRARSVLNSVAGSLGESIARASELCRASVSTEASSSFVSDAYHNDNWYYERRKGDSIPSLLVFDKSTRRAYVRGYGRTSVATDVTTEYANSEASLSTQQAFTASPPRSVTRSPLQHIVSRLLPQHSVSGGSVKVIGRNR